MVNIEAYTITEYVMYIIIMYAAIVACVASSYMSYVLRDKTQSQRFWLTLMICVWFASIVFFDIRIGHVFAGIGATATIAVVELVDAVFAFIELEDEDVRYVQ